MRQSLKIIAISALATAAVIKAVPAFSEPDRSVSIVSTSDLDLSTARGRAALDHRLVNAAQEACGRAADVDVAGRNAVRACRFDLLAKARAETGELLKHGGSIEIASSR